MPVNNNGLQFFELLLRWSARDVPPKVMQEARRALLDGLSCILLGAGAGRLTDYRLDPATGSECMLATAFSASGSRLVSVLPAMTHNACLCQVHDANDGHTEAASRGGVGHPGRTIIPTALAFGEALDWDMETLLVAIVAAYDFGCRMEANHKPINLEAMGPLSVLARAKGVDASIFQKAAGLAWPLSPQILPLGWAEQTGHNFLRCGAVVHVAWEALQAAIAGIEGPDPTLDAAAKVVTYKLDNLAEQFMIMGRYTKPFPSCRMTHGAVECALALRKDPALDIRKISSIVASVIPGALYVADRKLHADFKRRAFSLPVCVAIALKFGHLTPDILSGELAAEIAALADITEVIEDPEFLKIYPHSGRPSGLRIHLHSGQYLEHTLNVPLGEPGNPESNDQLIDRFCRYGKSMFSAEVLRKTAEMILCTDEKTPVRSIIRSLNVGI